MITDANTHWSPGKTPHGLYSSPVGLGTDMEPEFGTWIKGWESTWGNGPTAAEVQLYPEGTTRFLDNMAIIAVPEVEIKISSPASVWRQGHYYYAQYEHSLIPIFQSYLFSLYQLWSSFTVSLDRNRFKTQVCVTWRPVLIHCIVLSTQVSFGGIQDTGMLHEVLGDLWEIQVDKQNISIQVCSVLNRTAVREKEWGKKSRTQCYFLYMGSGLDMIHRGGRQGLISRMQVNKRRNY